MMPLKRVSSWPKVAERLAILLPIDRLEPEVVQAAAGGGQSRWVLAVSGGADSVALVLLVWAHWPKQRGKLVLAHFNHRLRGAASAGDARFCAMVARGLGIDFETAAWTNRPEKVSEADARAARNRFLGEVRRKYRSSSIWTGHQQDDVAETMLMRLSRGAGTKGLAAPRPVQSWGSEGRRMRPLLGVSREELRDSLTEAKGRWREDDSNAQGEFFRNRVRGVVVPAWVKAAGRNSVQGAALSRRLLAEDDAALEAWLDELAPINIDGSLKLNVLKGRPLGVWRRALQRWLLGYPDQRGDLSRRGFEQLLKMAQTGKTTRFSLGSRGFARIRRGRLYFEKLSR